MKKTMKTIASLVMMLVLLLGIGAPAYADGIVSYQGGAEKFVFLPGSSYTDTDLFDGFKNVMPGDTLTQTVEVRNRFLNTGSVRIYLRAVAHDEQSNPLSSAVAASGETVATMSDFLSQLYMEVWQGDKCIYTGSPDELDGLAEPKLLGTFRKGETATLTVELTVPLELDNDFANRLGEVDWKFTAEEYTSGGGKPTVTPGTLIQTGQLNWPIAVLAAAGGVLIALGWVILRKKRHGNA